MSKINNLRSSYRKYLESSTENVVDIKLYLSIAAEYNKFLIRKALEGNEVTLPARLGTIQIIGRKPKITIKEDGSISGLAPDWVKTKQLRDSDPIAKEQRKVVYHLNNETDGYRYSWKWSKFNVLVENKSLYSLIMTRNNKRAVHKNISEGKQYKTK